MRHLQGLKLVSIFSAGLLLIGAGSDLLALPFNDDMVNQQLITGKVMRPKIPGSVPYGSLEYRITSMEEALKLKNPLKGDEFSALRGQRLYAANCSTCHGSFVNGKHVINQLAPTMPSIDLGNQIYKDKPDGHFYGYMHLGGVMMPPLGWKLSPEEHWDIVNYLRKVQNERGERERGSR